MMYSIAYADIFFFCGFIFFLFLIHTHVVATVFISLSL